MNSDGAGTRQSTTQAAEKAADKPYLRIANVWKSFGNFTAVSQNASMALTASMKRSK